MRHFPPALTILARAASVNLRAAMVIFGTSRSLLSSVTVATDTTILSCPLSSWAILEIEIGGLFTLEEINLLSTVWQKAESVLLERNLKSCKHDKPKESTYSDEEVEIKIVAPGLLLVRVPNSSSFHEINTLQESQSEPSCRHWANSESKYLPFCVCIYIK